METIDILLELARENAKHIEVLNGEYGVIANDIAWLKSFFWAMMLPAIGATVAAAYSILLHRKSKK